MWGPTDDKSALGQVLPTFSIHVDPQRLTASRLKLLEQFVEVVSKDNARSHIYALTQVSVQHGRAMGVSSREILFLLRLIHGRELPQNVAYCVTQWAERFGEATLREMIWLTPSATCSWEQHDQQLTMLSEGKDGKGVFVTEQGLATLVEPLRKAGYYPSIRRLAAASQHYQEPEHKDNGIFNHSLRLAVDLAKINQFVPDSLIGGRVRFLKRLASVLGLVGAQPRQRKEAQAAAQRFAQQSTWQAQGEALASYLADVEYSEIGGFEEHVGEQVLRELDHLRQPQQVRDRLCDYLLSDGPAEWTPIIPFIRRLRKESPKLIRVARSWDWSYLRRHDRPWEEVEDYWLSYLLTHEFWWLGLVELYCTKAQGCAAFRLTSTGLALLRGEKPPIHRSLVMAPTGWTVLEPLEMAVEDLIHLLRFVQSQPLTCQWMVYCDQETIYDGIVDGLSLEQLRRIAAKYGEDLPSSFTEVLDRLETKGKEMSIEEGYLLTCQSESLMDSVFKTRSMAQCIAQRLAPTASEVYPAAITRFLRAAERSGISVEYKTEPQA